MRKKITDRIKEALIRLPARMITATAIVIVSGLTIWAMAAFTEPTSGPAASVQDFAKNILGANNADNGFDSSSVAANADGSIIEREEYMQTNMGNLDATVSSRASQTSVNGLSSRMAGPTAISAEVGTYTHAGAAGYCRGLSATAEYAIDGSDTSTTYTDWRLPTISEMAVFEGQGSGNYIWTASVRDASTNNWFLLKLSNGSWTIYTYDVAYYVRCVR